MKCTTTTETRMAATAPPISPSQLLLGLMVGASWCRPMAEPTRSERDVVGHGHDDRGEQEHDAVPVREEVRVEQQCAERPEHAHPCEDEDGRDEAGHRVGGRLHPGQVPDEGAGDQQDEHERQHGHALVVRLDHQRDHGHETEQSGGVVVGAPERGVGLGGGQQHHDGDQDHARHRAGGEAGEAHDTEQHADADGHPHVAPARPAVFTLPVHGAPERDVHGARALGSGGWGGTSRDAAAAEAAAVTGDATSGATSTGSYSGSRGGVLAARSARAPASARARTAARARSRARGPARAE